MNREIGVDWRFSPELRGGLGFIETGTFWGRRLFRPTCGRYFVRAARDQIQPNEFQY
jgi:hypothetical protein